LLSYGVKWIWASVDGLDPEKCWYIKEYAQLRYYYLIVTREAMGFRRHKAVEDVYRIPPKRKYL